MSRGTNLPKTRRSKTRTHKDNQTSRTSWLYKLFHYPRTHPNPKSRTNKNDKVLGQVPGHFLDEKAEERSLCVERRYRFLESYQMCEGSHKHYEHYVHKDDTTGNPVSCWKCLAASQRKKPIRKTQGKFRRNPEKILSGLRFECFPNWGGPEDFPKLNTCPVLIRGTILLVKRYNNYGKSCPTVEEYAEIPITESGSVQEIVISVVQYYRFHFQSLRPHSEFDSLTVLSLEKIDETHYQCNLNM
jgi:hypothetical protein